MQSNSSESYQLSTLQNLFFSLCNQKQNPSPQTFPQTLNQIGKIIVWGQQNNSDIFQFVCEVKLFEMLLQIFSKSKNKDIINGIIGFYNMLLTNLNKQQTINYLLSHPCIIAMQLTKFGNMGNQIAEYYINFLKGISRKITVNTVHIFFNKRFPNFPLLWQNSRFFNHPQNLVRTTSRNIMLSLSKFAQTANLQNKKLYEYFTGFPFVIYYMHECNFLKQYWRIIDDILDQQEEKDYELQQLDNLIQDHEEFLFYLDDLLNTKRLPKQGESHKQQTQIEDSFISAFVNQCLSKLILSLCSVNKSHFGIKTSLLVFILLLNTIRNKFFIQTIVLALFGKYYNRKLSFKVLHPIDMLISYNKEWKFKGFWDPHQQKIQEYCSKTYYVEKSIIGDLNSKNSSIKSSQVSQTKSRVSTIGLTEAMSVFGVNTNFYQRQVQKLEQIFGLNILKKEQPKSKIIVITIGQQKSSTSTSTFTSSLIKQELKKIENFQGADLMNDYEQNPVNQAILSFLNTKDDTLIILTLNLLDQIIKNKLVEESLLDFCKLNIKPKTKDFSSIISMQKIVFSCVKIFQVDPPSFRICTYKAAASVLLNFSKFYTQSQNFSMPQQLQNRLKKAFLIAIQRVTPYLYGGKQWQKSIELYNLVNKQNSKFRKNTIKTYGLIPQEHFVNKQSYNFCQILYEEFPQTFEQQIGRDFWVYVIIKQTFETLFGKQNLLKSDIIPSNQSKNQLKYEQGKSYDLQKDEFFTAQFKLLNSQRYNPCEIILLGAYIVIGSQKKVEYKCRYQQTILLPDKSDPRKLILKQNKLSLSIQFQSLKEALLMKQNFKQNKNLLLKCELADLIKQIESMQNRVKSVNTNGNEIKK